MVLKPWNLLFLSAISLLLTACGTGGDDFVNSDKVAPIITLNGSSTVYIKKGKPYNDLGATAVDDVDGVMSVSTSGQVLVSTENSYTITYEAVDKANNKTVVKRTVYVDGTAPKITMISTIKEGSKIDGLATAVDTLDGNVDVEVSTNLDSTTPGTYRVTYTATDRVGNIASTENSVTVIPFSITELFEKSKELNDVSYLVVGDSTRYYEGTNNVLINSRDSDNGYYKDVLSLKKIKFMHTAIEGQTVYRWLRGERENRKGGQSFTIGDTLAKIGSVNANHCIVEFSMGINDDIRDYIHNGMFTELKNNISRGIKRLKDSYPNIKILLVSPVPYEEYSSAYHSPQLNRYYEALKDELHLPFVSGYDMLRGAYPDNTLDKLHPKEYASKELVRGIFEQIENGSIYP